MKRRNLSVIGGAATAVLIATAAPVPATAAPAADPAPATNAPATKQDDRPDRLASERRSLTQQAVELVVNGDAQVQDRGGSKAVRVAPGQWAQYGLQSSDELFSILVEFGGDTTSGTGKGGKGGKQASGGSTVPTSGPLHNQIPQPDRANDNSTYWTTDFNRQHYLDMFFNGMREQGGESFKSFYEEASSGRYTVDGDVSEWVKVDKPESAYGLTESHEDMTYFIDDTAEAWYDAQVAAGKSKAQIVEYLKGFDQWDRYDHDADGDFSEPDGYIDHFQAIHAGEGEEAGAPEWTIWSHRWAVNQNGFHADGIGPDEYEYYGGIEIGDTGLWIRDYTTEPENGGLGVFAHEYAHDLGLPDFYDTAGGENSTAYWTLMSSGSWLGHGDGAIGTTPNQLGPWEKLQLGWLDYEVARAGVTSTHTLGSAHHATKKAQALITVLPKQARSYQLGAAVEGSDYFYSGRGDNREATMTSPEFTVPAADPRLTAKARYEIEVDWDYAYAEVSVGGGAFEPVPTSLSTSDDPNGSNEGFGITGSTGGQWVDLSADLSQYAGQSVRLRFRMVNDAYYNELGFMVDAINVGGALSEGAEDGATGWALDEFTIAENGQAQREYSRYYIAENRTYLGYDSTLRTGPYNFGWGATRPNWVEHFPYQDGLLLWYWNTEYSDNNTSAHPGAGEILPVDARGAALRWSDGTVARNRIQAFDSTFGLEPTDPLSLHRETTTGMTTLTVPSRPGVAVFDDRFGDRYYDPANPRASVKVPNTGTRIEVISTNDNAMLQVKVN